MIDADLSLEGFRRRHEDAKEKLLCAVNAYERNSDKRKIRRLRKGLMKAYSNFYGTHVDLQVIEILEAKGHRPCP